MPDNEHSRNYYDYLTGTSADRVMSGSATYDNPGRNAVVRNVYYTECSIYDDLEPTTDGP